MSIQIRLTGHFAGGEGTLLGIQPACYPELGRAHVALHLNRRLWQFSGLNWCRGVLVRSCNRLASGGEMSTPRTLLSCLGLGLAAGLTCWPSVPSLKILSWLGQLTATFRPDCAAIPVGCGRSANLIGNALKFTSRGEVVVQVCKGFGTGRISISSEVQDSGIGIPLETYGRLFQALARPMVPG